MHKMEKAQEINSTEYNKLKNRLAFFPSIVSDIASLHFQHLNYFSAKIPNMSFILF